MKHFYTLFISLFVSITCWAQTGNWTDEGNYDISWYKNSQKEFELSTPQQLAGLAYLINSNKYEFAECTITLTHSFSLEEHYWIPVKSFSGKFDGNNQVISGMTIATANSSGDINIGFISILNGSISNLTIDNTSSIHIPYQGYEGNIGGFAGKTSLGSSIRNCHFEGKIQVKANGSTAACKTRIGGIFGVGYATVENCNNSGDISGTIEGTSRYINADCCGGIAGMAYTKIAFCNNSGNITLQSTAQANLGGIAGYAGGGSRSSIITGCSNTGHIISRFTGSKAYIEINTAGITGRNDDASVVYYCSNSGTIEAFNSAAKANSATAEAGGITGSNEHLIINCYNTGTISSESISYANSGGIASTNYNVVANCYNLGNVKARGDASNSLNTVAGGIAGNSFQSSANEKALLFNCYNTGEVTSANSKSFTGGVAGKVYSSSSVSAISKVRNCYISSIAEKGIGSDDNGQEENIEILTSQTMQSTDFPSKLNGNLAAFNDTTQNIKATLWSLVSSTNNGYPYLAMPEIKCETINPYSVKFSLDCKGPLSVDTYVKYGKLHDADTQTYPIRLGKPVIASLTPNTTYQYQLVMVSGDITVEQLPQTVTMPSVIVNISASDVKRRSATLKATLSGDLSKIKKVEFVLSSQKLQIGSDFPTPPLRYQATLTENIAIANLTDLVPDSGYSVNLYIETQDGNFTGGNFQFSTPSTGRVISEATQREQTQSTISFMTLVGSNAKEPEGTLKECGVYYLPLDTINAHRNEWWNKMEKWNKIKGTPEQYLGSNLPWFKILITDLIPDCAYAIRAYVIVDMPDGESVEDILNFEFDAMKTLPVYLQALEPHSITQTSAVLEGSIDAGDAAVVEKGFSLSEAFSQRTLNLEDGQTSYKVSELSPATQYSYHTFVTVKGGVTFNSEPQYFNTLPISCTASAKEITQTSAIIQIQLSPGDAILTEKGIQWRVNGQTTSSIKLENDDDQQRICELPANARIEYRAYMYTSNEGYCWSEWKSFTTKEISTAFQQADAMSNTSATLHATVECDTHSSAQFGFEWRKYDAPDLVPSNTVIAEQLTEGKIAFSLKGLTPSTYYKYRSFVKYQDKEYFSEWTAFGTADVFVLWVPTVQTLAVVSADGTSVTLLGYIIAGSEDIIQQGFEYWIAGPKLRAEEKQTIIAPNSNMQVAVTDLEPNKTYKYRAFAKTASGTTYGEEMEFKTGAPTGIRTTDINPFTAFLSSSPITEETILTIEGITEGEGIIEYRIYTLQGILVNQGKETAGGKSITIPIYARDYSNGIHLIQIIYKDQIKILKMSVGN